MHKIAFIGTGIMGKSMASNLLKAGYPVTVYNRTRSKADTLIEQGAQWADTPAQAAQEADFVISMVGTPQDVRDTYLGEGGVLQAMRSGSILIDMTTSSPRLAAEVHQKAKERGVGALDAPVTGGPAGAENATLIIMVGGDSEHLERAKPVLEAMGQSVLHYGEPGNGQRAKLVNQTVAMLNMLSAIEGLFFARKAGLDTDQILSMLQAGLADSRSLRGAGPLALKGDFQPNFHPAHVVKDLTIAIEESDSLGLDLAMLKAARGRWQKLLEQYPNAAAVQEVARLYF